MNKQKAAGIMALFAVMITGIGGLAVASTTSSTGSVTGSLSLAPVYVDGFNCPSFVREQSTICTIRLLATAPGSEAPPGTWPSVVPSGTVTFSSSSPTGSFTGNPCTLKTDTPSHCNVTYTDTMGGTPKITATYSGDVNYGAGIIGTNVVNIDEGTCSISTSGNAIDLSSGKISSISVTNGGTVNADIMISGTDWYSNAITSNSFPAGQTQWSANSTFAYGNGTPLTLNGVGTNLVLEPNAIMPIYVRAVAPTGTPPGSYSSTITVEASC